MMSHRLSTRPEGFTAGKIKKVLPSEFTVRDSIALEHHRLWPGDPNGGLKLSCDTNADVPERVVGDRSRLRQIIINLIGNGIKFTERGQVGLTIAVQSRMADESLDRVDIHQHTKVSKMEQIPALTL
jgi:signal transduction histidine kinase